MEEERLTGEPVLSNGPYPTDDPVLGLIGNTPLIRYPGHPRVWCKLESENPTRSVKDRIAMGILTEALAEGKYDHVVEASSGNTAGAVALVANRLGVSCTLTCPSSTSPAKVGYMRAFGATVHRCPSVDADHPEHYRAVARRLADTPNTLLVDQYHNERNPGGHYRWLGPELWAQAGESMTHLVGAMGTGGALSGSGRYIREQAHKAGRRVTVVGVDAACSNISNAFYDRPSVSYDTSVEGLGKGGYLPTMWFDAIDEIRDVGDTRAFAQARTAAREQGLLMGPSAGAALAVAIDVANEHPEAQVVTIVCDGGEQYFDALFPAKNDAAPVQTNGTVKD